MPVRFELREHGQVIYFKITEPWTTEEVVAGFGETRAIRDMIYKQDPERRVHLLVDLMEVTHVAPGVAQVRAAPGMTHPGRGEYIVAATYQPARDIMMALFKVMHADGKMFSSLDEAWTFLRGLIN